MQQKLFKNQSIESSLFFDDRLQTTSKTSEPEPEKLNPVNFETRFQGHMDMYGEIQAVAEYLDAHEGWFCRCAQPMKVEPLGKNGYNITIGRFNSLGYEVEPKISVVLQPPKDGIYLMHTIEVPNYNPPGYEVDYRAWMKLQEIPAELISSAQSKLPKAIARIEWELHMKVAVRFPKFIYRLPLSVIQTTGDRLLAQIVRQVSPRLTYKVQQDFHSRLHLPVPPNSSRKLQRISLQGDCVA